MPQLLQEYSHWSKGKAFLLTTAPQLPRTPALHPLGPRQQVLHNHKTGGRPDVKPGLSCWVDLRLNFKWGSEVVSLKLPQPRLADLLTPASLFFCC